MTDETQDIYAIFKKIKTINDLKENEKLIVDTAVTEFEAGLKAVEELAAAQESPQTAVMKLNQIQVDLQALRDEIDDAMNRLREIPGADDIIMSIQGEVVGRYGAITSKISMLLPQIMGGGGEPSAATGPPQPGGDTPSAPKDRYERMVFKAYTPAEGEKFEVVEVLKSVNSARALDMKKGEIFKLQHEFFTNELEKLKEIQGKDQTSEDVQTEFKDFTYRYLYISSMIANEFSRLEAVTGISEPFFGLDDEITKEIVKSGDKIMMILEELGADKFEEFSRPPEIEIVKLGEERVELDELAELYKINSGEELMKVKDEFFNKLQQMLETNLETLKEIKSGKYPQNEAAAKVDEIEQYMELIGSEMEKELKRIEALPGGREAADAFMQEAQNRFVLVEEIQKLLDEL